MTNKQLLGAKELSKILGMSVLYCYKLIAELNGQLEKDGYMIVRGKVSRAFFEERFYKIDLVGGG